MSEIKDKLRNIDLVQTMESYGIDLKRFGSQRLGCICPFHADTAPSLIVYVKDQRWKCFGCGLYGDVADFVSKYENINLKGALQKLGVLTRQSHDQKKYHCEKRDVIAEFKRRVRITAFCICKLMEMWENALINSETHWCYYPDGFVCYNRWFVWQSKLHTGTDREKYELSKEITVNKLVNQARKSGLL